MCIKPIIFMHKYYHDIGKRTKDSIVLVGSSFDGKDEVTVTTPKNPTRKQAEDTVNFILGELDDHDMFDDYIRKTKHLKFKVAKLFK